MSRQLVVKKDRASKLVKKEQSEEEEDVKVRGRIPVPDREQRS